MAEWPAPAVSSLRLGSCLSRETDQCSAPVWAVATWVREASEQGPGPKSKKELSIKKLSKVELYHMYERAHAIMLGWVSW
jgi:hypothetical protein